MREVSNRNLKRLVSESQNKSTAVYEALSSMASKDPSRIQEIFSQYQAFLGSKGVCFHDSINTAAAGSIYLPTLAPYFKKLYGSLDPKERGVKIYKDLLRESMKGIAFHEIGHSLGLRHNFASSWDSLNYPPQYWQLRTNEGQSTDACAADRSNEGNCMGPRYLDPMTDDEAGRGSEPRPGIEYWANTSTMEYQIERGGETVGAGTYDLHAMKTLYGRSLETFDSSQVKFGGADLLRGEGALAGHPERRSCSTRTTTRPRPPLHAHGRAREGLRPEARLPPGDRRGEGDRAVASSSTARSARSRRRTTSPTRT